MQGVPREDGFDITVASEIMAILCLAADLSDLKARLGRVVVAYTYEGKPVTAADLKAQGIVAVHLITAGEGPLPGFYEKYGFKKEKEVILMGREL